MTPAFRSSSDAATGIDSLRVLVVEDHPAQRSLLSKMLALLGVKFVMEAECGRDAISLLHDSDFGFDIVITDLRMPNGDGLEVIRAITQNSAVHQVVMLTAVDDDIVAALRSLPDEINGSRLMTLDKPISLNQLGGIVTRTLQCRQSSLTSRSQWPMDRLELAINLGEMQAHLEPQLDLRRGEVIGFEALVRWHHPESGVLSPAEFIPQIEGSRLMMPLTLRVMESALDTLGLLRAAGYGGGCRSTSVPAALRTQISPCGWLRWHGGPASPAKTSPSS